MFRLPRAYTFQNVTKHIGLGSRKQAERREFDKKRNFTGVPAVLSWFPPRIVIYTPLFSLELVRDPFSLKRQLPRSGPHTNSARAVARSYS